MRDSNLAELKECKITFKTKDTCSITALSFAIISLPSTI